MRILTDIFAGLGLLWTLIAIAAIVLLVLAKPPTPPMKPPCEGRPAFRIHPIRPYDWKNDA